MGIGQKIAEIVENHRDKKRKSQSGAVGQFWRDGGNALLYDLPVTTGSLVIDAGGYEGEWSAGMISRYGCTSQIFEPVPAFFEHCQKYFKHNSLVNIHKAAIGGSNRKTTFSLSDNGTSEYLDGNKSKIIEADVIDVAKIFSETDARIACFKLNIEGGEYEVLDRMINTNNIARCDSFLIQFHRQPEGYSESYNNIVSELHKTHTRSWCYEMIWEKWLCKNNNF